MFGRMNLLAAGVVGLALVVLAQDRKADPKGKARAAKKEAPVLTSAGSGTAAP